MIGRFTFFITGCFFLLFCRVYAGENCRIDVVDESNGWPVPMVELRTTHNVRFVSDNAGIIAFDLPELMGKKTWFTVEGHGYYVPKDGFGFSGVRLTPLPGKRLTLKVKRRLPGKRLGRITGCGIFGESQKLGLEKGWKEQGIMGCDSVQNALLSGRLFWLWGDTKMPGYALGLFDVVGATTALQPLKSFKPPVRLRYDYFTGKAGVPRVIGKMPGSGPTWIGGTISLPDKTGKKHLVGTYVKVKPPMTIYEIGMCVWDNSLKKFKLHRVLWNDKLKMIKPKIIPNGHPVRWTDKTGKKWILTGVGFPDMKFPATFEGWNNPKAWQPVKKLKTFYSISDNEVIKSHACSIAWNAYRGKWVAIFSQVNSKKTFLGEVWYAEAKSPLGPWSKAIKVVTHNNYTIYNPKIHPGFTPKGSPILLFEGTYTATFARKARITPRYDYNQVLYRLDLNDPIFDKIK